MDKMKIFIIGIVTFLIVALIGGLFMYWFAGSMNFFGEQGFHGDISDFFSGLKTAGLMVAPCVTAIVYRICKYKKQAGIMLVVSIICWVLCIVVIPLINITIEKVRDSASPEKIALRAIEGTDDDIRKDGVNIDSAHYAERVGNRLWIFEGTSTRLPASKEKEVVEAAAEMINEKSRLKETSPAFSHYGWRSIWYDGKLSHYEMVFFYDDGSYVYMYDMDKERWEELGLPEPPRNEGIKNATF
ncbi:MAG: hypothetical protein K6G81_03060 [Lachnospiraceae bacterium]|nr:hypothetical protein [Lachnospiraceae bacterium]